MIPRGAVRLLNDATQAASPPTTWASCSGGPRAPSPRHRQPAPEHRDRRRWKRRPPNSDQDGDGADRRKNPGAIERINYRECLTPVRALYLDLAHWAVEDPGRLGVMGGAMPDRRGGDQQEESQTETQVTYGRPHPGAPARSACCRAQRRRSASNRSHPPRSGRRSPPPARRSQRPGVHSGRGHVGASRRGTTLRCRKGVGARPRRGRRRDLVREENHAFWAWAIVEVLGATGIGVAQHLDDRPSPDGLPSAPSAGVAGWRRAISQNAISSAIVTLMSLAEVRSRDPGVGLPASPLPPLIGRGPDAPIGATVEDEGLPAGQRCGVLQERSQMSVAVLQMGHQRG